MAPAPPHDEDGAFSCSDVLFQRFAPTLLLKHGAGAGGSAAAANCSIHAVTRTVCEFTQWKLHQVQDKPLSVLFDEESAERILRGIKSGEFAANDARDPYGGKPLFVRLRTASGARTVTGIEPDQVEFAAFVQSVQGWTLLELDASAFLINDITAPETIRSCMERVVYDMLSDSEDLEEADLCDAAVRAVVDLTGYQRVCAYRFEEDASGRVVAERLNPASGLGSFLGLHFPASDIPPRARAAFHRRPLRLLEDSVSKGLPLLRLAPTTAGPMPEDTAPPAGFTPEFEAAHPCHAQYLANLGARGSLTLAVAGPEADDGRRIWGLLVGHHTAGRMLDYARRRDLTTIAQALGRALERLSDRRDIRSARRAEAVTRALKGGPEREIGSAARTIGWGLSALVLSTGFALVRRGAVEERVGCCPPDDIVTDLCAWVRRHSAGPLFATECLTDQVPEAVSASRLASGAVVVEIPDAPEMGDDPSPRRPAEAPGSPQANGGIGGLFPSPVVPRPPAAPRDRALSPRPPLVRGGPKSEGYRYLVWFRPEEIRRRLWAGMRPSVGAGRSKSFAAPRDPDGARDRSRSIASSVSASSGEGSSGPISPRGGGGGVSPPAAPSAPRETFDPTPETIALHAAPFSPLESEGIQAFSNLLGHYGDASGPKSVVSRVVELMKKHMKGLLPESSPISPTSIRSLRRLPSPVVRSPPGFDAEQEVHLLLVPMGDDLNRRASLTSSDGSGSPVLRSMSPPNSSSSLRKLPVLSDPTGSFRRPASSLVMAPAAAAAASINLLEPGRVAAVEATALVACVDMPRLAACCADRARRLSSSAPVVELSAPGLASTALAANLALGAGDAGPGSGIAPGLLRAVAGAMEACVKAAGDSGLVVAWSTPSALACWSGEAPAAAAAAAARCAIQIQGAAEGLGLGPGAPSWLRLGIALGSALYALDERGQAAGPAFGAALDDAHRLALEARGGLPRVSARAAAALGDDFATEDEDEEAALSEAEALEGSLRGGVGGIGPEGSPRSAVSPGGGPRGSVVLDGFRRVSLLLNGSPKLGRPVSLLGFATGEAAARQIAAQRAAAAVRKGAPARTASSSPTRGLISTFSRELGSALAPEPRRPSAGGGGASPRSLLDVRAPPSPARTSPRPASFEARRPSGDPPSPRLSGRRPSDTARATASPRLAPAAAPEQPPSEMLSAFSRSVSNPTR